MNRKKPKINSRNKVTFISLFTATLLSSSFSWASDSLYEFNSGFIVGSKDNIDLNRFNQAPIAEGNYSVDVYTNNQWKGRHELSITQDIQGNLGVCYTAKMLTDFGVIASKLNEALSKEPSFCGRLSEWKQDKNVYDNFNPATLRLDLAVAQLYEQKSQKGYIAPEFWQKGIPALNVGYMGNYYNSHYSAANRANDEYAYIGINAGLSIDGWLLKHIGNFNWRSSAGSHWNNSQTYLQRPLPIIKSKLTAGQFYTEGSLFDSINLKGARLATDNQMYPDGMANYAPEIRGIAQTNALVTVRQNGAIIYQTSVPPGPFNLTDVNPTGYGNDLQVTIIEADGREDSFSVPYSSLAILLRPGFTQYQVAAGKTDVNGVNEQPYLLQSTIQYGLNNTFTVFGGLTLFDSYQAYLFGTGINTGFGALALDVTRSQTEFKSDTVIGQSYRVTFNRQFTDTKTNLMLAAYRYSTKNYYNTNDAVYAIDYDKRGLTNYRSKEKNTFSFTVNQMLPDGFGGIYFNGRISNYWGQTGSNKQYQMSYNNSYQRLSYSLSLLRVYQQEYNNNSVDNRVMLNFNFPLSFGSHKTNVSSNTAFNNSHFASTQLGMNGSLDDKNNWTYGVNTSTQSGGKHNLAMNTSYRNSLAVTNASYSFGDDYRQFGAGIQGGMVLHSGGITLTPNNSKTMVLVEAKGAHGASLYGVQGAKIDRNGYALTPSPRAYRVNTIAIDPQGSPDDIVFTSTSGQVVPYEGSIVKLTLGTKKESTQVFNVLRADGLSLPFGADVLSDGRSIGVVGQGGTVFIHDVSSGNAYIEWKDGECHFSLSDTSQQESICY